MFTLPSNLFTVHEDMVNAFIEGETGAVCTLIYPDKWSECSNCYIDLHTQKSSNVYKTGGPISFAVNTMCPICNGTGRLSLPTTKNIRVRFYPTPKSWSETGIYIANPDGAAIIIGYITDVDELNRSTQQKINNLLYNREGEYISWGFRAKYFSQVLRRCQ